MYRERKYHTSLKVRGTQVSSVLALRYPTKWLVEVSVISVRTVCHDKLLVMIACERSKGADIRTPPASSEGGRGTRRGSEPPATSTLLFPLPIPLSPHSCPFPSYSRPRRLDAQAQVFLCPFAQKSQKTLNPSQVAFWLLVFESVLTR